MWLYGSGFPKSMNIAKGVEGKLVNGSANPKDFKKLNGKQVNRGNWGYAKIQQEQGYRDKNYDVEAESKTYLGELEPTTNLAKQWQGYGTQLKPSFEPIIVARKPFKGSCVDNVLKYGVGGINIDECRVGNEERTIPIHSNDKKEDNTIFNLHPTIQHERIPTTEGRFPANTILTYDETDFDEVCGGFPNTKSQIGARGGQGFHNCLGRPDRERKDGNNLSGFNDSGSASRYFYCAKASKKDRDEGLGEEFEKKQNIFMATCNGTGGIQKGMERFATQPKANFHPTVKPTSLMQYLVRLVTPKGGTILDPFMGSGSTGKAVMFENKERQANYSFIGIEKEKEYCDIATARIEWAKSYKDEKQDKNQVQINELGELF